EIRPPEMISLSMSMPPSSQPSQWLADGGANTAQLRAVVEYGAISGAATARMTKNAMMPSPSAAVLRSVSACRISPARPLDRVPARSASVAMALIGAPPARRSPADPGIELEIRQVGEQVEHHDRDGQDQEAALQHRVVPLVNRLP